MDINSVLFEPTPLKLKTYSNPHHGLLMDRIWRMQTVAKRPISAAELAYATDWDVNRINGVMVQAQKTYKWSEFIVETDGKGADKTYFIKLTEMKVASVSSASKTNPNYKASAWGDAGSKEATTSALDNLMA